MNTVDTRYGPFKIINGDSLVSNALRLYGEWAHHEIELMKHFIVPGAVIVDAGAFIGTHARAFSEFTGKTGKVFAFEPRCATAEVLSENIKLAPQKNIFLQRCALGAETRSMTISSLDLSRSDNFGAAPLVPMNDQEKNGDTINIVPLDALILGRVDFLKIDVEGMEVDVLKGARETVKKYQPIIFAECNSLESSLPVLKWCEQELYSVFGVLSPAYNFFNFNRNAENIFGEAQEAGLLLIPNDVCVQHEGFTRRNGVYPIKTADQLALLLLHKPQYPYEVLIQSAFAKDIGVFYPSPLADARSRELLESQRRIATLNDTLSVVKQETEKLQQDISQRDQDIVRQDAELAKRTEEIDRIKNELNRVFQSRSWRITRPLRFFMSLIQRRFSIQRTDKPLAGPKADSKHPTVDWSALHVMRHEGVLSEESSIVDVIVPVYKGMSETRACIESVLANPQRTRFELIVIDDCSPEPELSAWLDSMSAAGRLTLYRNTNNLGFVGTVNRGMMLHPERDILLLNSDAIVANDWLDRMRACSQAENNIATVTPFSNNATICSYPKFCEDNELPTGWDLSSLDNVFAAANKHRFIEIPTGVGFCFYIRRAALNVLGLFDVERFGKGYGEENDFCQRAVKAGWRNVLAADVFVQHLGAVSFAANEHAGKRRATEVLLALHPNYQVDVHRFINADPIRPLRLAADLHRLADDARPVVLAVSHSRGGGTQKHVDDLAKKLAGEAHCLLLRPVEADKVQLKWNQPGESLNITFGVDNEYTKLIELLRAVRVSRIHFHHLLGVPTRIWQLAKDLSVEYDFTTHDYYSICPQISLTRSDDKYCGERGLHDCRTCLNEAPAPGNVDIEVWRRNYSEFLGTASRVFCPSEDTAKRIKKHFPFANVITAFHPEDDKDISVSPREWDASGRVLKVVVIGALSKVKGADLLEACAIDAAKRSLPLKFDLIGYAYRSLKNAPEQFLSVHGPYEEASLRSLLERQAPDLVWFPAQCPETYSYTLSAAIAAGASVLIPNIGAFSERIAGRQGTWIYDWDASPETINELLLAIKEKRLVQEDAHVSAIFPSAPTFDYSVHYLSPVPVRPVRQVSRDLDNVVSSLENNNMQARKSIRMLIVGALVTLRSQPSLHWLARRIPLSTQIRIKNWLLRQGGSA